MSSQPEIEQQLIQLLSLSLSPTTDPLTRKNLDQNIKHNLPQQQPLPFITSLTNISINPQYQTQIRLNALVLLRTIPLHPTNKIWSQLLTPEQQRQILNQLFNALLSQPPSLPQPEIINQLARVIAQLAKNSPEITLQSSGKQLPA